MDWSLATTLLRARLDLLRTSVPVSVYHRDGQMHVDCGYPFTISPKAIKALFASLDSIDREQDEDDRWNQALEALEAHATTDLNYKQPPSTHFDDGVAPTQSAASIVQIALDKGWLAVLEGRDTADLSAASKAAAAVDEPSAAAEALVSLWLSHPDVDDVFVDDGALARFLDHW